MIKYLKNKKGEGLIELFIVTQVAMILFILIVLVPNAMGLFKSTFNSLNPSESTQIEKDLIVK